MHMIFPMNGEVARRLASSTAIDNLRDFLCALRVSAFRSCRAMGLFSLLMFLFLLCRFRLLMKQLALRSRMQRYLCDFWRLFSYLFRFLARH